jgi:hypothetical protein
MLQKGIKSALLLLRRGNGGSPVVNKGSLSPVHSRPVGQGRAQLDDGGARIADGCGLVAAEIMRGGFEVLDRPFQLADGGYEARMLGRLAADGLRSGERAR